MLTDPDAGNGYASSELAKFCSDRKANLSVRIKFYNCNKKGGGDIEMW